MDMECFQSFVACGNTDVSVCYFEVVLCVESIVTACNCERAAAYGKVGVGVKSIVRRVNEKGTVLKEHIAARFQPLHAGTVFL